MKGLISIRNIFILVLILVFAGCADLNIKPAPRSPKRILNADATITFVQGKLDQVTQLASKRRGEVFRWKIVPPNNTATICIKNEVNNPVPFTESDWTNQPHCITRKGTISGTVRKDLEVPNGIRIIEYTVQDSNGNIIDPDILVY